jgi:gliding motility-associated-like protein
VTSFIKFILLSFILLLYITSSAQSTFEICDNGIDDDNDGFIDIQDEDCFCPEWKTKSIIPNASFELQDCCPESASMASCASGWLQASLATPDYFHACDYSGSDIFNLPQPIPDGEGFIGFIDGSFTGDFNPKWKEYVGTCLTTPLQKDTSYQLQFHLGFMDREVSPEINMAIFGTADCDMLPFDNTDNSFGCPTGNVQWVRLGGVSSVGQNEWKPQEIIFKSTIDVAAIVVGPDCSVRSATNNPYHFMDNLILAKLTDFDVNIKAGDDLCAQDFMLQIRAQTDARYQWYKDDIAIANATQNILTELSGPGSYRVRIENEVSCFLSKAYEYFPPVALSQRYETICKGDSFQLGDQVLNTEGIFRDTFKILNNCDSIVIVNLALEDPQERIIEIRVFPGEEFEIGTQSYSIPGNYSQTMLSDTGCDSTIHLQLSNYAIYTPSAFSPNSDGINDIFTLHSDTGLQRISSLLILDRNGNVMFDKKDLESTDGWDGMVNGTQVQTGVYTYMAIVLMDDGVERSLSGTFSLVR